MPRRITLAACGVAVLLALALSVPTRAQLSGTSLPGTCTAGATFSYTAYTPSLILLCSPANVWVPLAPHSAPYAMGDNATVPLFTVSIPTEDTGCSVHASFTYTVTNATNTVSHSGIIIFTFVNQNGTVTGNATDSGESVVGTGCGLGCDSWSVTAVGTLATANAAFNNTLSQTGSLAYRILNDSCPTTTFL